MLDLGVPMPRGILEETLSRLGRIVRLTSARRIVVLGDLIHAANGLSEDVIDTVARWRERIDGEIELVCGNHDAKVAELPSNWAIMRRPSALLDAPFVHQHDARPSAAGYALGGHLHPMVRLRGRIDRVELPCFVVGLHRAILPAFTLFSRGVRVEPEPGDRLYAVADGTVVDLSSSAVP